MQTEEVVQKKRGRPPKVQKSSNEIMKKRVMSNSDSESDEENDFLVFRKKLSEENKNDVTMNMRIDEIEKKVSMNSYEMTYQRDHIQTLTDLVMRNREKLLNQLEKVKEEMRVNEVKYTNQLAQLNGKIIDYEIKFSKMEEKMDKIRDEFHEKYSLVIKDNDIKYNRLLRRTEELDKKLYIIYNPSSVQNSLSNTVAQSVSNTVAQSVSSSAPVSPLTKSNVQSFVNSYASSNTQKNISSSETVVRK